jgi:hypothetical protein
MPRPGFSDGAQPDAGPIFDVLNNIMYNWEGKYPCENADLAGEPSSYNFRNNRYSPGPDSNVSEWVFIHEKAPDARAHWHGNTHYDAPQDQADRIKYVPPSISTYLQSSPFPVEEVVDTQVSDTAMRDRILAIGGASFYRDTADVRVATSGTAKIIDSEPTPRPPLPNDPTLPDTDGDGIPDDYEDDHLQDKHLNKHDAKDANLDPDGNGYSHLEEYLQFVHSEYLRTLLPPP